MTAVIILVMLILHFIASVMKGVYNFIKGRVFGIEPAPVEGKGWGEGKGTSGEGGGADVVEIEEASLDGERKVRVMEDGECEVCASPCDKLRRKYAKELKKLADLDRRIEEIRLSSESKPRKAKLYRAIEQELAEARRADR